MTPDLEAVLAYVVELERNYKLKTIAELKEQIRNELEEENGASLEAAPVTERRHRRHRRKKKWKQYVLVPLLLMAAWLVGWLLSFPSAFRNVYFWILLVGVVLLIGWTISLAKKL